MGELRESCMKSIKVGPSWTRFGPDKRDNMAPNYRKVFISVYSPVVFIHL